jgi:hypothetical protein
VLSQNTAQCRQSRGCRTAGPHSAAQTYLMPTHRSSRGLHEGTHSSIYVAFVASEWMWVDGGRSRRSCTTGWSLSERHGTGQGAEMCQSDHAGELRSATEHTPRQLDSFWQSGSCPGDPHGPRGSFWQRGGTAWQVACWLYGGGGDTQKPAATGSPPPPPSQELGIRWLKLRAF